MLNPFGVNAFDTFAYKFDLYPNIKSLIKENEGPVAMKLYQHRIDGTSLEFT